MFIRFKDIYGHEHITSVDQIVELSSDGKHYKLRLGELSNNSTILVNKTVYDKFVLMLEVSSI